ncbi:MAG: hypothetical protein HRU07_05405 [Nitrosopumilus sp.]|nr:hypothetical protein [Nitrosopumilus sp.]NRA05583.1 hypothetical protein [Nitrosopumilus sp.]
MIKKIGIPIISAVVIFAIAATIDFDDSVTLANLPQNIYSVTPVTTPIKVTTLTIEPSLIQVDAETKTAEKTIIDNSSYSGAGFVFPFLQKSFGIDVSTTTLTVDDWDLGSDSILPSSVWVDETGGANNGNVYYGTAAANNLRSLNPATDVETTWDIGGTVNYVNGNTSGEPFFFMVDGSTTYVAILDPINDELTKWNVTPNIHGHENAIDDSGIIYSIDNVVSTIHSLNPSNNELKVWDVQSVCPKSGFAFHGLSFDSTTDLIYANQLEVIELCVLDPSNNDVTLYDTGLDFGRTWHNAIGPTNPGHVYVATNLHGGGDGRKVVLIDTINNESTVWELTGQHDAYTINVDSNGLVWIYTVRDSVGTTWESGLVMLNPATNSVTEWSLGYDSGLSSYTELYTAANGDVWVNVSHTASGTNDHLLRFSD